ncbi:protein-tyrosine sulfotransferase-like [Zingiber officinale]|uniref:protein-tyrosine sulfotransferase-like n=1 Tax=Zingiber officinale TaxID=94328 RepID=UPI001C4B05B1|nr:protein-tyrosine sulfotransferase-like [Zingiber officinale]XP_042414093.1 protein-tyrosine sulfotransferase-like [Zingiber officinale]XP_042414094.1 protein-tyrosine sulfotransferase-like [Zingiber officinale]
MTPRCKVMSHIFICGLLIFIYLVSTLLTVSSSGDDYLHCESIMRNWVDSSMETEVHTDELILKDLLFFLHVPRTGGRTYFHCLLRKLYTSPQKCPLSYDKLRLDPSKPNCRLMVSHDDYSLISKLPKHKTSVVTILRHPIDRVFSTYESSVELAAEFLVHPNLTSTTQMFRRIVLDIWPWKYLVPWMRQDLFVRRHARELGRLRKIEETNNPYDMEEMVMPLQEFINDPIAHEIIHNGATFQVAGLTNNSYLEELHDVRNCLRKHPEFGHYVLEVAKHRLDHMLYVGLTEEHKKSANMFAELVGAQVISQSEAWSSTEQETTNKTEPSFSYSYPADGLKQAEGIAGYLNITEILSPHDEPGRENMTVGKLIEAYEKCNSNLRKFQTTRHTMSLKRISPVKFSKKARRSVPASILDQIQYLNSLDVELYKHAQDIFRRQEKHVVQNDDKGNLKAQEELQTSGCGSLFSCLPWKILSIIAFLAVIVLAILVTKRRRAGKLKMF